MALEHRRTVSECSVGEPPTQLRISGDGAGGVVHARDKDRDRLAGGRGRTARLAVLARRNGRFGSDRRGDELELGVLAQDGGLDPTQLGAGLDAELTIEQLSGGSVELERVGLAAGA